MLSSAKKKWPIKPWEDLRKLKCILLSEKSHYEKATYCMIPTTWHSGKGKTMATVKRSVVARDWGGERDEQAEHRAFLGQWKYGGVLHYNDGYLSLYICPRECTTQAWTLNCGLWVIMMCQHRFIACNKVTILVGDVNNGASSAILRARSIWEISGPSIQFCYEPKSALKNKIYF